MNEQKIKTYPVVHWIGQTSFTHNVNIRICEREIREKCPRFFNTKFGKRETFSFHRGFIISRHTVQYSNSKPERKTVIYLYDVDDNQTYLIDCHCKSVQQAKSIIDHIIKTGEFKS